MLKIGRLTDYAVVLLSHMQDNIQQKETISAKKLSILSNIPLPTVSKLLKIMAKSGLIKAKRGIMGGYEILEDFSKLSLLNFIEIFEGPTHITDCLSTNNKHCDLKKICKQKNAWDDVNLQIKELLSKILLKDFLV